MVSVFGFGHPKSHFLHPKTAIFSNFSDFKNQKGALKQIQRQWTRQQQRQRHRWSARITQHVLYFWKADVSLIPIMIINTTPCSRQSPCLVTLVTQFRSYYQFYRVECFTVSGFLIRQLLARCVSFFLLALAAQPGSSEFDIGKCVLLHCLV